MMERTVLAAMLFAALARPLAAGEAAPGDAEIPRAIVMVAAGDESGETAKWGLGFLLAPGRVVFQRHLLLGADQIAVISAGQKASDVKVMADAPELDIVLLKADGLPDISNGLPPASAAPGRGESVYVAVVSPSADAAALIRGSARSVVGMGLRRIIRIEISAPAGCAGGPVFTGEGAFLGFANFGKGAAGCSCRFSADGILPLQGSQPVTLAGWHKRAEKGTAAASDPRCAPAYAALRTGKLRDCLRAWRETVELHPKDPEPRIWMGMSCLRRSNPRRALEAFEEAVRLAPDSQNANFGLAIAYARMDRLSDAHGVLKTLAPQMAADARVQLALGIICEERGDFKGASRAYRAALQKEPALVRFMLRLDPDDSITWLLASTGTGGVYGGRPGCFFDEALKIDPNWPEALVGQAWTSFGDAYGSDPDGSLLKACRKALELKPDMAAGHYVSALIHYSTLEYDEASASMKKAAKLDPEWALPHYWLGSRCIESEDVKAARRHLNALRPLDPDLAEDLDVRIQNVLMMMR